MNPPEGLPVLPRLSFRDGHDHEEALHRLETREIDEQYSIDLAEKACDALHRFALDRQMMGLAELESDITERALSLVEHGMSAPDAVSSILAPLQHHIQEMMHAGTYAFHNEHIFEQLGKGREQGLIGDVEWILRQRNEALPENQTRQIYTNADLDQNYAIDFIEAVWEIDPTEDELTLVRIDFVQKKTRAVIPEKARDEIVRKHREFVRDHEMVIAELRVIEATQEQIAAFKAQFGETVEIYLATAFEGAYTGPLEQAEPDFIASLGEFRTYMEALPVFVNAQRSLRRAYIEQLAFIPEGAPQDELVNMLSTQFEAWKDEWLATIPEKRIRELSPVRPIIVRSIISSTKAPEDIIVTLSDLTE